MPVLCFRVETVHGLSDVARHQIHEHTAERRNGKAPLALWVIYHLRGGGCWPP